MWRIHQFSVLSLLYGVQDPAVWLYIMSMDVIRLLCGVKDPSVWHVHYVVCRIRRCDTFTVWCVGSVGVIRSLYGVQDPSVWYVRHIVYRTLYWWRKPRVTNRWSWEPTICFSVNFSVPWYFLSDPISTCLIFSDARCAIYLTTAG